MASAVREMGFDEVELAYLKTALDANSADPDINRLCAIALRERKRYDEAIICWHRVEQAKPEDEEAAQFVQPESREHHHRPLSPQHRCRAVALAASRGASDLRRIAESRRLLDRRRRQMAPGGGGQGPFSRGA